MAHGNNTFPVIPFRHGKDSLSTNRRNDAERLRIAVNESSFSFISHALIHVKKVFDHWTYFFILALFFCSKLKG